MCIANTDEGEEDMAGQEGCETVIDIVANFQLKEINLEKKDWMVYVKGYLKALKERLEKDGKADRVAAFQKGATELVKFINSRFDEFQIFTDNK